MPAVRRDPLHRARSRRRGRPGGCRGCALGASWRRQCAGSRTPSSKSWSRRSSLGRCSAARGARRRARPQGAAADSDLADTRLTGIVTDARPPLRDIRGQRRQAAEGRGGRRRERLAYREHHAARSIAERPERNQDLAAQKSIRTSRRPPAPQPPVAPARAAARLPAPQAAAPGRPPAPAGAAANRPGGLQRRLPRPPRPRQQR